MNTRKDWSPTGVTPPPRPGRSFEGTVGNVRVWRGRALTEAEVRSVYSHVGTAEFPTNLRVIRPHAHKCPTCHFLWYCENDDIVPEQYMPAVPSDGWPTTSDGHDCSEYPKPIEWFAKGDDA